MPTREQLHKEVDAVPEDQLDNAQVVVEEPIESLSSLNDDDAMLVGHEAAIERLRADPVAWATWQAEIAELDGTLSDGLGGL
jgi:hypothetical protein